MKIVRTTPEGLSEGLTPTEAADLEQFALLIDGQTRLDDFEDETLERLIAAFGLDGLAEAFSS